MITNVIALIAGAIFLVVGAPFLYELIYDFDALNPKKSDPLLRWAGILACGVLTIYGAITMALALIAFSPVGIESVPDGIAEFSYLITAFVFIGSGALYGMGIKGSNILNTYLSFRALRSVWRKFVNAIL